MSEQKVGAVAYEHVDPHYLERRRLRKTARWGLLWALGVGAVISGAYFGWNFGLVAGGFTGLVVATVMVTVMYVCLVFSIAELTAALPHAGGFYSFTRNAFGPTAGYICGVTDTIEYVLTPAVIVVGIGGYLHALWPAVPPAAWWVLSYVLFVAVNLRGVSLTLRVGLVITVLAVAVLVVFYVGALATGAFRIDLLSNVPPDAGRSATWLPKGAWGVFAALPFAIWFYLAIEQLPLAAEETHDVVVDMPKALLLSIATLLVLSFLTLVLNTGVGGGAAAMGASAAPLGDGFRAVFGDGATTAVLTLVALAGLVASFHGTVYAYGRVLFALSRAGYFPRWISLTNTHGAPAPALLLGAAVGLACAVAIELAGKGAVGAALLNMAVFGAVISYTMVLASYVRLRLARPDLPRPYRSPLGVPGAVTGAALSLVALAACFSIPDLRAAVWGVALFLAVAVVYFLVYSRHRLVAQAPEEQVALGGHDAPPAAPHP